MRMNMYTCYVWGALYAIYFSTMSSMEIELLKLYTPMIHTQLTIPCHSRICSLPLCSGMGLIRPGWPRAPAGPFPTTWLVMIGGVCGLRNKGDMLRLLFMAAPELGSPVPPLFLFWGPVTNSSASSIIIP